VAVLAVEVDEIREHHVGVAGSERFDRNADALRVGARVHGRRDAAPRKDVGDLADSEDVPAGGDESIEPRLSDGFDGVVPPVGCANEGAGLPDEGARNHATDGVVTDENGPGESADLPETFRRPDLLVRGDLEDGIAGRVEDRSPRRLMLRAQLLNDLGSRRRLVAKDLLPEVFLEGPENLRRKPVRIERERALHDEPHHFPVTRRRVLSRRELVGLSAGAGCPASAGGIEESEQSERLEVRQRGRYAIENVTERVGAGVAVRVRIRSGAHAETVADDDQYPPASGASDPFAQPPIF
jgi:hypothetical protein